MKFDELPNLKFHHSAAKYYHKTFLIFEYNIQVTKNILCEYNFE